ncbi:MAG TPA: MFS transporter [Chloroflexota bacterium]|nr:MFS transporter [Chloroflexota bacterium]
MSEEDRWLRRNFSFDAVGALGTGLFNALVVNFLSVIARKQGADPVLLAALAAAPFAANTLSIFFGVCQPPQDGRVRFVSTLLIVGRALFLGGLFISGPLALLSMALGMWLTMAMVSPLQVDIWRGSYPQRMRARVLGYLRVLQTSAGAIAAPLGGLLLERFGPGPMLSLGAALGILGAAGFSRVRSSPVLASQRFTPFASLRLLAEHASYRRLVAAWVVWGFGAFMATPLYALVLVDQLHASYSDVGLLQLAGALSGLLAYFGLGQVLDRAGARQAAVVTSFGFLLVAIVPLVYVLAPNLTVLALGYVLLSVGTSANDLGWQLALITRLPDEHRLRYQAAHTSITGLRGVAAPFVGSAILGLGFGVDTVLVLSAILGVIGAALMAGALGVDVRGSRLGRAVLGNAGGPGGDFAAAHRVVWSRPSVLEAPALDIDQVLLARQQRAAADGLGRDGRAQRGFEAAHELLHDPAWQPVTLARVDEPEQDQVSQQHPPVGTKTS